MQDCAEEAFCARLWGRGMMPHHAQVLPQAESRLARLLTPWHGTLLQRRKARLRVLHPCQRFVPAMVSCPRDPTVFGIGPVIVPTGPLGVIARFL